MVPGLTSSPAAVVAQPCTDWIGEAELLLVTRQLLHRRLRNAPLSLTRHINARVPFHFSSSHPVRACRSFLLPGLSLPLKVHSILTSTFRVGSPPQLVLAPKQWKAYVWEGELWEYSSDSDVDKVAGDLEASKCSF